MAAFRTATEFVIAIENTLGWAAEETPTRPLWKTRQIEAGKIKRRIATNPSLFTWDNLEIALEYCRAKRMRVRSPVLVTYQVERALAARPKAEAVPVRPLGERVDAAVAHEMFTQADGWDDWVGVLTRASGSGRQEVLAAWQEAGRDR